MNANIFFMSSFYPLFGRLASKNYRLLKGLRIDFRSLFFCLLMSNDLFSLNGKVALVTGSSTGLGKVMARALGRAGRRWP